jgi:hypothetical protein
MVALIWLFVLNDNEEHSFLAAFDTKGVDQPVFLAGVTVRGVRQTSLPVRWRQEKSTACWELIHSTNSPCRRRPSPATAC